MLEMFNILDDITENTTMCGGIAVPDSLFNLVATIIRIIKIVVPILLIIWGMLDFAKAVISQKEDDIKAGQAKFMKRLIAALIVFLIVTVVQLAINIVGNLGGEGNDSSNAWTCAKSLINGQP